MTKRLESKFHICKKLNKSYKNIWGLPKGESLRSVKNKKTKKKKVSVYGKLLGVKQALKFFYCNMQEKAFKRVLKRSAKSPLTTLDRFISFLEGRLDVVLFRSSFCSSLYKARQMINHGNVIVNGLKVKDPGTQLFQLDVIELKKSFIIESSENNLILKGIKDNFSSRFLPPHLEIDYKSLSIIFLWDPNYKDTYYPIKANYGIIHRFYR
jgi:small subunit ribosomal protein S4|tara:strand:+ start:636 stop:1265 length:630 start_codon:yes stop_codon:yes gene_type:complete